MRFARVVTKKSLHLPLVASDEALRAGVPPQFERLVRTAAPGSPEHRGGAWTVLTLTSETARRVLPPSLAEVLERGLEVGRRFVGRSTNEKEVAAARSFLFSERPNFDARMVEVLQKSSAPPVSPSALQSHARHVTLRYGSLAAYFALAAGCRALDGLLEPEVLLDSLQDQLGARTYLRVGLGSARNPELLERAKEQAAFECARPSVLDFPSQEMLALQIFHEFLGARYRTIANEERMRMDEFLLWATRSRAN